MNGIAKRACPTAWPMRSLYQSLHDFFVSQFRHMFPERANEGDDIAGTVYELNQKGLNSSQVTALLDFTNGRISWELCLVYNRTQSSSTTYWVNLSSFVQQEPDFHHCNRVFASAVHEIQRRTLITDSRSTLLRLSRSMKHIAYNLCKPLSIQYFLRALARLGIWKWWFLSVDEVKITNHMVF